MTTPTLASMLAPVSTFVNGLDLSKPADAEARLAKEFPPEGPFVAAVRDRARAALAAGEICQKGENGMKFSRVAKPEADPGRCSIDAVHMDRAKGPFHTHLRGEVCLCLPDDATATFEGRRATWMVLPVGSRHEPRVDHGSMLILYWWPEGAVAWG
jgi:hypothetical protein